MRTLKTCVSQQTASREKYSPRLDHCWRLDVPGQRAVKNIECAYETDHNIKAWLSSHHRELSWFPRCNHEAASDGRWEPTSPQMGWREYRFQCSGLAAISLGFKECCKCLYCHYQHVCVIDSFGGTIREASFQALSWKWYRDLSLTTNHKNRMSRTSALSSSTCVSIGARAALRIWKKYWGGTLKSWSTWMI